MSCYNCSHADNQKREKRVTTKGHDVRYVYCKLFEKMKQIGQSKSCRKSDGIETFKSGYNCQVCNHCKPNSFQKEKFIDQKERVKQTIYCNKKSKRLTTCIGFGCKYHTNKKQITVAEIMDKIEIKKKIEKINMQEFIKFTNLHWIDGAIYE